MPPRYNRVVRVAWLVLVLCACRIETATPSGPSREAAPTPSGDVWVYTSMYRTVLDALDPVLAQALPTVTVHWYQAGSEKIVSRLEAELVAGGTPCDVLITSDPFLYQRYKREGRWLRYVSPNAVRVPRPLMDPDGSYAALRVSTMVIVHRPGSEGPTSFASLVDGRFKNDVVLGDPLTSGTAFTWAMFMDAAHGSKFFDELRANGARVGGGNAAVLQKVEGGEAAIGVLLLENALTAKAKGSRIEVTWPTDGAVLIPGYGGVLATSRNAPAAKAVVDVLHGPKAQEVIARPGDMHATDPRVQPPGDTLGLEQLVERGQPWSEAVLDRGLSDGARVKTAFSQAFSR